MDKRLKNLLEALKLKEDELQAEFIEPYVDENYVNSDMCCESTQSEEQYVEQVELSDAQPVLLEQYNEPTEVQDSSSNITQTEIYTQEDTSITETKQEDLHHAELTYVEEATPQQPSIGLVDYTGCGEVVEPKDTGVDNRDIFIQRMLEMGFIVNNKKLNTGSLYDFRYSDIGTLPMDINKLFDDAFDFNDEPQKETLVDHTSLDDDSSMSDEDVYACEDEQVKVKKGLLNKIFNKRRGNR